MKYVLFFICFLIFHTGVSHADSVSIINQQISPKVLKHSTVFKTAISTRKGTAHILLRRKKVESEIAFFEGTVNNTELVSAVSDGNRVIIYFTLRGVHFMYESAAVAKLFSRESLPSVCGSDISVSERTLEKASHKKAAATLATHLRLSVIVDRSGVRKIGSDLSTKIKAIVSRINQIYRSNLSISVQLQETIKMSSDLSASDIESLLSLLQRRRTQIGISSQAKAAHLITGRTLEDDGVIGLAYLGTVCRFSGRYRFGVSQFISKSFQPTLMAHEIGHNLNASHSDSGIMQAILSGPLSSFSSDSKNEIGSFISQYGSCLK